MSLIISKGSAPMYSVPFEESRIEDILRYGTPITILQENGEWVKAEQGWIRRDRLGVKDPSFQMNAIVGYRGAYLFTTTDTVYGPVFELPFESEVQVIEEYSEPSGVPTTFKCGALARPNPAFEGCWNTRWVKVKLPCGKEGYIQRSQLNFSSKILTLSQIIEFSQLFLETKYLWGGTSSFGYDCSGFVQMLYRQGGILLSRNSYEQHRDPRLDIVQEPRGGDLIFFKNGSYEVVHVGMLIDEKQFIHAFTKDQAWVCISPLIDTRWDNGYFYHGFEIKRMNYWA